MKKALLILTTLAVLFATAPEANAKCHVAKIKTTSKKIILSELYPSPSDGGEEFIELHNTGRKKVDVAGWKLIDASGKTYEIDREDVGSTIIKKNGYLSIPQSASKIFLNNSSDSIALTQADDTQRGSTEYVDAQNGMSWSYIGGSWQWTDTVTSGSANANSTTEATTTDSVTEDGTTSDTSYETSTAILLSELLPDPEGSDATDEWIEIVNSGESSVNINGWQLRDSSKTYTIENHTIAAGEELLFSIGDTHISLNNSGETIELVDPFETVIDSTTYENGDSGSSWARFADGWQWTSELTPGADNTLSLATDEESGTDAGEEVSAEDANGVLSITEFRQLADDASGVIEGVVTVEPGVLGSQYFYIQDADSGIQVYSYNQDFPELSVGDHVTVTGTKSQSRNETRIKTTTSADIVVNSTAAVTPHVVTTLDESTEGLLVSVNGTVTDKSSTEVVLDGALTIVIRSDVSIDMEKLNEGNAVTVLGIVGQSNDEYRVMPRSDEDVSAATSETAQANDAGEDSDGATAVGATQQSSGGGFSGGAKAAATGAGILSLVSGLAWRNERVRSWILEKLGKTTIASTEGTKPATNTAVDTVNIPLPPIKKVPLKG